MVDVCTSVEPILELRLIRAPHGEHPLKDIVLHVWISQVGWQYERRYECVREVNFY